MRIVSRLLSSKFVSVVAAACLLIGLPDAVRASDTSPAQFLEEFGAQAIKVLSETTPGEERREIELRRLLANGFDVELIGRFVLARYWRTASDAERADFRQLFEDYLIAAYGRRFGSYNGEKFVIGQTFPKDDERAVVRSEVTRPGGDTLTVDWSLQRRDGRWRVVDIMVEGISMMVTQRSEFTAVIQREGGSVSALNAKLRAINSNLTEQSARKNAS